jgi:hypothetical protein
MNRASTSIIMMYAALCLRKFLYVLKRVAANRLRSIFAM